MKPLLIINSAASAVDVGAFNAFAGVIMDIGCDTEVLRSMARLAGRSFTLLARVEPLGLLDEEALNLLLDSDVDGIVLSGCRGRADIQQLDVMLRVAEAASGIAPNRVRIHAEYGGSPEGLLSPHPLTGSSPRLGALIFNGAALARSVGCLEPTSAPHQRVAAPILAGRAYVVLRASEAGVPAYEMLPATTDEAAARWAHSLSRDNGFASVVCNSIEQATIVKTA
ncbi:aldolase [Ensifer adhaerens]|uniref:aldolase n=1 Tax=Ensifer adhaerens TaxID=106592 RepID=UPI0023A94F5B|nr:aldolase [Ensifer adhaerens]WDZ78058.1 aldolase [Ensifer adhaerens]